MTQDPKQLAFRLRNAIHIESAKLSPHTSELIEVGKLVVEYLEGMAGLPAGEGESLRWKLIETYERPEYAGWTDLVLLGWDTGDPHGVIMFFGVGWCDAYNGSWIDCSDKKPWPMGPTHWLCSLRHTFEQDFSERFLPTPPSSAAFQSPTTGGET